MFTISPSLTDLKVKERNIYKMLYSMNSPQVATPELSVEEARCYVLFFSEGPNLSAYIGLYLPRIDRKIFYAYTSNPFPFEAAPDVEFEATGFAEDMGFLLDEISVSGMPADDRNRWIEEQYIFGYKKPDLSDDNVTITKAENVKSALTEKEEAREAQAKAEQAVKAAPAKPVEPSPAPIVEPVPHLEMPVLHPEPAQPQPPVQPPPQAQPPQQQPYPLYQQPVPQQGQPMQPPYPPQQPMQPQYPPQQVPQQGQQYPPQPYGQPPQPYGQPQQPYGQPPYGQPQQYQQPYPQQGQPMTPQYPMAPPQPPPVFEQPAAQPKKAQPPQQAKAPQKKKVQKAPEPVPEELFEETVPVELDAAPVQQRSANVFEEALREGVVKPPKPKTSKAVRPASGVVPRDKEALARLLASF
ncbi:MAG: hypothetical protein AABZ15_09155 [Nitrospirota bacterium]